MLSHYRYVPNAEKEAKQAAEWYEDQQAGLGGEFLSELAETVVRVRANPRRFARSEWGTRKEIREAKLHRFPYLIVFEFINDVVVILAVAHAHRRPGYWKRRRG